VAAGRLPRSPARRLRWAHWRSAPFASLDFETTGLDYLHDDIVSIGVVPIQAGRISVGGSIHQLVEPATAPRPSSVKIHGMRRQDLAGSPRVEDLREMLRDALNGRFILAWYAPVEAAFLAKTFGGGRRSFRRRMIDVRELAIAIDRQRGRLRASSEYSLSACAARHGVPIARPHDAFDDALVTGQLFLVLASRLQHAGPGRVGALLRAGRA
jgi:DNA polymerase III subunit epsilon